MPCENIQQELDDLRAEVAEAQAEFTALVGSAKSQSPLRNIIANLGKTIATKESELRKCQIVNGIIYKTVRTTFRPETDGFLFTNLWTWDATERQTLHKVVFDALNVVEGLLSPILWATLEPLFIGIPFPFDLVALAAAVGAANDKIVDSITEAIEKGDDGHYGLCGGMAFAALDYWHKRWVVPQGIGPDDQPQRTSPQGTELRNYIWIRLLKSVQDNMLTFLQWMGMASSQGSDGTQWLLDRTIEQCAILRNTISSGRPVPIGLVGTTSSPFHNHQVLCYGFKDELDDTTTLFIYDNNTPKKESVIRLDFSGSMLQTVQDDTFQAKRGPLRGLFCEVYMAAEPPKAVVLRQGLSVTPALAGLGRPVDTHYIAGNVGYQTSTPMSLIVSSDQGTFVGEATPTAIAVGDQREMNLQLAFGTPGDYKVAVAAELGFFGPPDYRIDIVKLLPPETKNQTDIVALTIFNGQPDWRWCKKCQGLFFSANATMGRCPAGEAHVLTDSGNYNLILNNPTALGQNNWKWCKNCQGLFFGPLVNTTASHCPAFARMAHISGGGDYTIEKDASTGGQSNWRRCSKCQGMYFAGNATGGVCPAGSAHIHEESEDYHLFQV